MPSMPLTAEEQDAKYRVILAALSTPLPEPRWYWESDGDPHRKTFYVVHTRKIHRIDCGSRMEAKELARRLNEDDPTGENHDTCKLIQWNVSSQGL